MNYPKDFLWDDLMFDLNSEESHWMCHRAVLGYDFKTPDTWKHLFLECARCRGSKILASLIIGDPPPIKIWMCLPCLMPTAQMRELIELNSMKDDPWNIPLYSMKTTFVSKEPK
jgi:hypothetical protein